MIRKSQIEAPVVPSRWGEEERRYARQLEELLERLNTRVLSQEQTIRNQAQRIKVLELQVLPGLGNFVLGTNRLA